jgi:cytochrome c551/c552
MTVYIKIILAVLIIAVVGIQFVPVERTNPEVTGEIETPAEVMDILRRSCYDCHSNETVWPWYSRVAPLSWKVVDDVDEGREEMNFSEWIGYSEKKKAKKIHEIWEEVSEGEMPPWYYTPLHPEAELSAADKETLRKWTEAEGKD